MKKLLFLLLLALLLVPAMALAGADITDPVSAANYLKGRAWFFDAGGNMTYECLMFRPEGPDEGKVQAYS